MASKSAEVRGRLSASNREQLGVDGHAHNGISAERVQRVDLLPGFGCRRQR